VAGGAIPQQYQNFSGMNAQNNVVITSLGSNAGSTYYVAPAIAGTTTYTASSISGGNT
jgi:hypothetical protein